MKNIGIFFGSRSPEHDISIITGMRVLEGLTQLRQYRAIPVYIDRKGEWFAGEALGRIEFFRDPQLERKLAPQAITSLSFRRGKLILYPSRRGFFKSARPIEIDIAFPCFHGSFGEDGTIQGLFEMAGIPYVGCGVLASATAMSKIHTRRLLRDAGIPSVPTIEVSGELFDSDRTGIIRDIGSKFTYPLFVKPNALGSSIAVAKVTNERELEWALEVVLQFDGLALVEEAVPNVKEVNVAVIGHRALTVSETEEPRFGGTFQTFEEKYVIKGGTIAQHGKTGPKTKSRIPADLAASVSAELKDAAAKCFRLIGASGISRFDFLINTATGAWYLGEVNILPGSLQSHLWAASGIPLPQLIEKLIGFAEERADEERKLTRTFASSVLQK